MSPNFSKAEFWEGRGLRGMSLRPIFFEAKTNYNQNSESNNNYDYFMITILRMIMIKNSGRREGGERTFRGGPQRCCSKG